MYVAHHAVKMDPRFPFKRQRRKEEIHQKRLTATDVSPQIQTRNARAILSGGDTKRAPDSPQRVHVRYKVCLQLGKSIDHKLLSRIADVAFVSEAFLICAAYGQLLLDFALLFTRVQ